MKRKHKIIFVLPTLMAGGAERVMSFVSENLNKDLFETTLLVIGHKKQSSYAIENLNVVFLEKDRVLFSFWTIFSFLKKHKPDIVISAIGHVNALMAFESIFFRKTIFIGREVNVISVLSKIQPSKKWLSFIDFTKHSYKLLDIILCQSKDMANDMKQNFDVPADKIRIINNPISSSFTPKTSSPMNKVPKFITVGSLVERKGHKRIIKSLMKYNGPFEYTIIGDGNMAKEIMSFAEEKGIKKYIKHVPFTENVSFYLKNSDVFLQGSYVEGFPNALLESCATGTPVIAYNALGGIDEIVENGVNGYIVQNELEFIDKLNLLLNQRLDTEVISSSVIKKFNSDIILKKYEDLFLELLPK